MFYLSDTYNIFVQKLFKELLIANFLIHKLFVKTQIYYINCNLRLILINSFKRLHDKSPFDVMLNFLMEKCLKVVCQFAVDQGLARIINYVKSKKKYAKYFDRRVEKTN